MLRLCLFAFAELLSRGAMRLRLGGFKIQCYGLGEETATWRVGDLVSR